MTKVVFTGGHLADAAMKLAESANVLVIPTGSPLVGEELCEFIRLHQPDAVIVRSGKFPREAINASSKLRFIAKHGVGVDTIDVAAATELGIPVTIAAGANAQSVAEHALALMMGAARRTSFLDARLRGGHWDKLSVEGLELYGKTLGIVGAGAIGRKFATLASALNMRVIAFDPFASSEAKRQLALVDSFEELLATSDVVSLHCPLTDTNKGLMGAAQFSLMKPSSILINTARGELVDIGALVDALLDGRLFAAGLDTFPVEPAPTSSPLWDVPNLVVTPHVGAGTREAKDRVGTMAVQQIVDWFSLGAIREGAIVNPAFADNRAVAPA